jgi:hypothetical protein
MNSTTSEVFELVFEELAEEDALQIAGKLLQRPVAPRSSEDATLDEELPALAISDQLVIERPHIRVLSYGDSIYDGCNRQPAGTLGGVQGVVNLRASGIAG